MATRRLLQWWPVTPSAEVRKIFKVLTYEQNPHVPLRLKNRNWLPGVLSGWIARFNRALAGYKLSLQAKELDQINSRFFWLTRRLSYHFCRCLPGTVKVDITNVVCTKLTNQTTGQAFVFMQTKRFIDLHWNNLHNDPSRITTWGDCFRGYCGFGHQKCCRNSFQNLRTFKAATARCALRVEARAPE